ncbi:MAG: threonine synthase [Bacillota bacterium]|nr:threonine synthase [Bacillota bacterium]
MRSRRWRVLPALEGESMPMSAVPHVSSGGIIATYGAYLPPVDPAAVVTLREGGTPLIEARAVSDAVMEAEAAARAETTGVVGPTGVLEAGESSGRARVFGPPGLVAAEGASEAAALRVYLKYEGLNPTGSFKDRGMAFAVSRAREAGYRVAVCASTGNTSASAAAYCARAGIRPVVVIPEAAIAAGKLAQAVAHGAVVVAVRGNFDQALAVVRDLVSRHRIALLNSLNPDRIEGQKTAAFEVCDQLGGRAPDYLAIPVGNAGNITAYWKGFCEYRERGKVTSVPRMLGFQAAGAAPIVKGRPIERPQTIATAIRIGNPASWKSAVAARDESGGVIDSVTDDEILDACRLLAAREGLLVEPASAASVAGVLKLARQGYFRGQRGATVVCVLTGHGLKDPDAMMRLGSSPIVAEADTASVEAALAAAGTPLE